MGTNVTNNLTALKFFAIATAIQKNLCLASCLSHLFLERKELLEVPKRRSFCPLPKKKIYNLKLDGNLRTKMSL